MRRRRRGAFEQARKEHVGQLRLPNVDRRNEMWATYQDELVRAYDAACEPADHEDLRSSAETRARQRFAFLRQASQATVNNFVEAETDALKRERLSAMTEAEFRAFTSAETLRAALIQRHTFDPLASFKDRSDTDLLNRAPSS